MNTDTRGIRKRLAEIKERLQECSTWSRVDVSWLLEQLEEALRKIERLEKSIEVRQ